MPACPSCMVIFFNKNNIEGTNSSKNVVRCLCTYVLFYICVWLNFLDHVSWERVRTWEKFWNVHLVINYRVRPSWSVPFMMRISQMICPMTKAASRAASVQTKIRMTWVCSNVDSRFRHLKIKIKSMSTPALRNKNSKEKEMKERERERKKEKKRQRKEESK